MPTTRLFLSALIGAVCLAAGPAAAATNLVSNGGFETGDFTGWSGSAVSALNGVDCPGTGLVPEGGCEAYFGSIGAAVTLQQPLVTTAASDYLISFAFQGGGDTPSSFTANWGGVPLLALTNPAAGPYTTYSFTATAASGSTVLSFVSRDDPGFLYLDAVSVTAVPEPASVALFGLGLAGLGLRRRRQALARSRVSLACALAASATVLVAPQAQARVTKITITSTESPTFGGYSWPGVGQYQKIVGKAFGELDPTDPKNAVIVDIALAPRNAAGKVAYSFDFYLLKPIDLSKGNHKMLYEPPNRGGKTISALNRGVGGNDPGAVTDPVLLANAFLMPQGYTISFSGWDYAAGTNTANFNATITLPVAKNPDGSTITGPSYEYIVTTGTASYTLNYPAASLDQASATLTHRVRLDDVPVVVPASGWAYNATGTAINLTTGNFVANDIYEFKYTAKDPTVNGIGMAAVRDWNAFLKYETADDFGTANPMAGDITRIYTEISSQPGRLLNDFRYFGFNQDEQGRKVLDGLMQWIAAGDGLNLNYRWSQPGRTERNRQDHLYIEGRFPFANVVTTDPLTGQTDGRLVKCTATNTCPLAMEIFSANEYWVKAASLMTTDPTGTFDLPDSPYSRIYFMSSMQHGTGNATTRGNCQQFQNPLDSSPVQRAMLVALDQWSTNGTLPPPSQMPKLSDGTFAPPLPQAGMGFPSIPGVTYNGLKTTRYLFDYGPGYTTTGIPTINPPVVNAPYQDNPLNGPIYPSFIPRTDSDGNDIAGIRLPRVTVPLATYTGWALRSGVWAGDGCEAAGQFIPFATTLAARLATGDPRPSAAERYGNYGNYSLAVAKAVKRMIANRTLLPADATTVTNDALSLGKTMLPLRTAP